MRKAILLVAPLLLLSILIPIVKLPAANADTMEVRPADVVVAKGHRGQFCDVMVGFRRPKEVNLYCFGDGTAWVKMRVNHILGTAKRVRVSGRGMCANVHAGWWQRDTSVFIKVRGKGTFDCFVTSILIRGLDSPSPTPTPTGSPSPSPTASPSPTCDPAYPTVCIPPPPPDLDCEDISFRDFTVLPPDPHGFDADNDGIGCESS